MKFSKLVKSGALTLSGLGLLLPQPLSAAAPLAPVAPDVREQPAPVLDIALGEGGVLSGQVVDAQGTPLSAAVVNAQRTGRKMITVVSDEDGRFTMKGLDGGNYLVSVGESNGVIRAWKSGTAPPAAHASVLLVSAGEVARGNMGGGGEGGGGYYSSGGGGGGGIGGGLLILGALGGIIAAGVATQDDDNGS